MSTQGADSRHLRFTCCRNAPCESVRHRKNCGVKCCHIADSAPVMNRTCLAVSAVEITSASVVRVVI